MTAPAKKPSVFNFAQKPEFADVATTKQLDPKPGKAGIGNGQSSLVSMSGAGDKSAPAKEAVPAKQAKALKRKETPSPTRLAPASPSAIKHDDDEAVESPSKAVVKPADGEVVESPKSGEISPNSRSISFMTALNLGPAHARTLSDGPLSPSAIEFEEEST